MTYPTGTAALAIEIALKEQGTIEELEVALKEIKAKEAKNLADEKTKKDALLERLGITADEIYLLLK
jgi:hypothetical protein